MTGEDLTKNVFARLIVSEALARTALAVAMAARDRQDQAAMMAELRRGLTISVTGKGADDVAAIAQRKFQVELSKIDELLGGPEIPTTRAQ